MNSNQRPEKLAGEPWVRCPPYGSPIASTVSPGHSRAAYAARTAEERLDSGDQLLAAERLDHVVVRSTLEPTDTLQLGVVGREHQHGHVGQLSDPLECRPPVEDGHRDVEDHELGSLGVKLAETRTPVRSVRDRMAGPLEQGPQELTDVVVVVHDEDA